MTDNSNSVLSEPKTDSLLQNYDLKQDCSNTSPQFGTPEHTAKYDYFSKNGRPITTAWRPNRTQLEEVKYFRKKGLTWTDIGDHYEMSAASVKTEYDNLKRRFTVDYKSWKSPEIKELIAICERENNYSIAAKRFNVSEHAAKFAYYRYKGRFLRESWEPSPSQFTELQSMRNRGMTWAAIGQEFKLSESGIRGRYSKLQRLYAE